MYIYMHTHIHLHIYIYIYHFIGSTYGILERIMTPLDVTDIDETHMCSYMKDIGMYNNAAGFHSTF